MANNGYFDIKRDSAIINAGGFFCQACLVGKPQTESSPDRRYCQGCYDFLLKEATMLQGAKRKPPGWVPKKPEAAQVPQDMRIIMSTLKSIKSEVDTIPLSSPRAKAAKRGPKPHRLPEELIKQLAGKGMGSKAIATKLKLDHGINVSYKTIQRVLTGERKQQEPSVAKT